MRVRVGPWPVISQPIAYRGRIWFANSVKGRNHNSADIWSLDPASGKLRYERHLYSQDAGVPLVYRGLLYWPFEDSRFSFGWGMVQVTDGANWQPLLVPTATIFHSDSLAVWRDRLLLVTSAWRTGFQVSDNRGRDWAALYDHPTPARRLSRFHEPVVLHGALYGYLKDPGGIRLVGFTGDRLTTVPGWPKDRYFFALTRHRGQLYALVKGEDGHRLWRTDGQTSERVGERNLEFSPIDLTGDGQRLWAVSRDGWLWSSPEGTGWTRQARALGGRPTSLHVIAGKIYVTGAGDDGRGILWGPPPHRLPQPDDRMPLPVPYPATREPTDWQRLSAELDEVLGGKTHYRNHARGRLRKLIFEAVERGPPPGFFARRLKASTPRGTVKAFGGGLPVEASDIAQTLLFWAMGLSKRQEIPAAILSLPWKTAANSFEKYFDPQLAAIWAVAAAGQKDAATVKALIERLDSEGDPLWLRSQIIGALTALTGKRYAYDIGRWREWWASVRIGWDG